MINDSDPKKKQKKTTPGRDVRPLETAGDGSPPVPKKSEPTSNNDDGGKKPPVIYVPARFVAAIDGETVPLSPTLLTDAEARGQLGDQLRRSKKVALKNLLLLLAWPLAAITQLIMLLMGLGDKVMYVADKAKPERDGMLDALLDVCPTSPDDAEQLEPWLFAVLLVVGYSYPLAPEAALSRIADSLAERKIKGLSVVQLRKRLHKIMDEVRQQAKGPTQPGKPICTVWPEMGDRQCTGFVIPAGWQADATGIRRPGGEFAVPCLWISATLMDLSTGEYHLCLQFRSPDGWKSQIVPQQTIADRSKIVGLAAFGMGVTSNNAIETIQFLAEFIASNATQLKPQGVTSQFGWQDFDGSTGFLLGNQFLLPKGNQDKVIHVSYQGPDVGNQQLAAGYNGMGNLKEWKVAMGRLAQYPAPVFAIIASLAAPLLKLLNGGSIGIDIAGITSSGKTTMVSYAASVWGMADLNNPASLIRSFNATPVYRERLLQVTRDLPVFLDETKLARDPQEVTDLIYAVSQGHSRGRGSIKGIAGYTQTRNITFITGEQSASSFTQDGGTKVRVLSMCELPFGDVSEHSGQLISELNIAIAANYGVAGRLFVQFLLDHQDQLAEWRDRFDAFVREYEGHAGANGFARRLAPCLAVIRLAAEVSEEAGVNPFPGTDPIRPLYGQFAREARGADRPAEALLKVVNDALARRAEMAGGSPANSKYPPREIIGNLDEHLIPNDDGVIEPSRGWWLIQLTGKFIQQSLMAAGFAEFGAILKVWRRNGWIERADGDHIAKKVMVDGKQMRLVSITCKGYQQAEKIVGGE